MSEAPTVCEDIDDGYVTRVLAEQEAADHRRAGAVEALIAKRPHLALAAFGIDPARYSFSACYHAAVAVGKSIRRAAFHEVRNLNAMMQMREDGQLFHDGDALAEPGWLAYEIAAVIRDVYRPLPHEAWPKDAEAHVPDARRFLQWLTAALTEESGLLPFYVAVGVSGPEPKRITFSRREEELEEHDPLQYWK